MSDCPRFGKLFGGCKFTPVYDTKIPEGFSLGEFTGSSMAFEKMLNLVRDKIYRGTICETCGKKIDDANT